MSFLTIFTSPKPFTDPHIATIQNNALASWQALGSDVTVILLGDEEGTAAAAARYNALYLPGVARNKEGTPLLSDMFEQARRNADGPLLAYVNADILLLPDFTLAARQAAELHRHFLLVGQRWDLDVTEALDFSNGWDAALRQRARQQGKLHPPAGSDYFIFPKDDYRDIPAFAIGRAGWDNWMIYRARRQGWPTIDATGDIFIIHQNHDYAHLPGGIPHYRQPETFDNIKLAGGRMITRFLLTDCNYQMSGRKITPKPLTWKRFWREVEIFPLVHLHSRWLGWLGYALFQPRNAYREARAWPAQLMKRGQPVNTQPGQRGS